MSKSTENKKRGRVSNLRTNQRPLSGYWSAPLPGGIGSDAVKSIAIHRYSKATRKASDNRIVKAVTLQTSFDGNDILTSVEIPDDSNIWG